MQTGAVIMPDGLRFATFLLVPTTVLALASPALAASPSRSPSPPPEAPASTELRPRLGIAGEAGGGWAPEAGFGVFGYLGVRAVVGAQIDDKLAVYLRAAGETSIVTYDAHVAVISEWTFRDRLSLGIGVGGDYLLGVCVAEVTESCSAMGISVPLVIGLHAGGKDESGVRRVFSTNLELRPGIDLTSSFGREPGRFMISAGLSFGFDRM